MASEPYHRADDEDGKWSTISSPGHCQYQDRSSSWSAWLTRKASASNPFSHLKLEGSGRSSRRRSDEAREELGPPRHKQRPRIGVHQKYTTKEHQDHQQRTVSGVSSGTKSEDNSGESVSGDHEVEALRTGNASRHSMHTVSKDDYLLARGANPRTGVVTPGHSLDSSIDDGDLMRARGLTPPAKWRQKGDQWISLDLDQETPLPSPLSQGPARPSKRHLRTPPGLTAGKYNRNTAPKQYFDHASSADMLFAKEPKSRTVSDRWLADQRKGPRQAKRTRDGTIDPTHKLKQQSGSGVGPLGRIPRKPVGSPPSKGSSESQQPQTLPGPISQANLDDRERSSSAPTPRKYKYFEPNDIGKNLPALPPGIQGTGPDWESLRQLQRQPFLGQRGVDWVEDVPDLCMLRNKGQIVQCQSTSSIPSRSPLSNHLRMKIPSALTVPSHGDHPMGQTRKLRGPRAADPNYPYVRPQKPVIPPRQYHLVQDMNAGQRTASQMRAVRHRQDVQIVHQPFQPQSMRGRILGPRTMEAHYNHQCQHTVQDIFTCPPSITSMSTDTHIQSSTTSSMGKVEENRTSSELSSVALPQVSQRMAPRPQMPDRAEGMSNVHKASSERQLPY